MEPEKRRRHKTLQQLIDFQDIVYTYPTVHQRPRLHRMFVEDYYAEQDIQLIEQELTVETSIVEQYGVKKAPHVGFFNMVNDSSDNKELPQRRDSSVQSFKIIMKSKRQFQSDSSESIDSNSSDFRRKSSIGIDQHTLHKPTMVLEQQQQIVSRQKQGQDKHYKELRVYQKQYHKEHNYKQSKFQKQSKQQKQILKQSGLLRQQKIQKAREIGCNCKKSHCLKMYCECFHLQIFCGNNCSCKGCGNLEKTVYHDQAVIEALTRNPRAFEEQNPEACFKLNVQLGEIKKGCKCKKTKCLKKYCECYNSGQKCGVFCKCQGCENTVDVAEVVAMEIEA